VTLRSEYSGALNFEDWCQDLDDPRSVVETESVKRILRLFASVGAAKGHAVLLTRHFSLWDAGCLGHLSVLSEFVDGTINLENLLSGNIDTVHAVDMTANQAALLVRFLSEHGQAPIKIAIAPCTLDLVLPHMNAAAGGSGEGLGLLEHVVQMDSGLSTGRTNLEVMLDVLRQKHGYPDPVSDTLNLEDANLSLSVLRLLKEAAELHRGLCQPLADRITTIRLDGNKALGGDDGGREAAQLLLRIIAVIAPRVETIFLRGCGLGDAFAAVFATGIPSLAHLRYLNLLVGNDLTSEGIELLDIAWRAARKPPVRMRTVINKDEGPLYFFSLLLSPHLAFSLALSLARALCL
jgi:hypothetical protein